MKRKIKKNGEKEKKSSVIKKNECPECGSENVFFDRKRQQIVCRDCGAIFEELMPEKERQFEKAHEQDHKMGF